MLYWGLPVQLEKATVKVVSAALLALVSKPLGR
jgi:hypothetical protein